MKHALRIDLPAGYRPADVLAFHGRDAQGVAERVTAQRVEKAVMLAGVPVLLDVEFAPGAALCTLQADGRLPWAPVEQALRGMLALRLDPAPFERRVRAHPELGPLVRRQRGLRIVQSATAFEALTWAIIGQQINLPFAITLRRTLITLAGRRHSSGMHCYPEAADVAALDADTLGTHKFSRAKAAALVRVSRMIVAGELDLEATGDMPALAARLLAIKGIGPWTVNYALLRGYGYADCSLHGDVAVRTALQRLQQAPERPDAAATERWLEQFQPCRTLAAAHLWASLAA